MTVDMHPAGLGADARNGAAADGTLNDAHAFLGLHRDGGHGVVARCLAPGAHAVTLLDGADPTRQWPMSRWENSDLFLVRWNDGEAPAQYRWRKHYPHATIDEDDTYRFSSLVSEEDAALWRDGRLLNAFEILGAHPRIIDDVAGYAFVVWAPHAQRVAVVGDFNNWDRRTHVMRKAAHGFWEAFIPGLQAGVAYKFDLVGADGRGVEWKADPFAFRSELRPATASLLHHAHVGRAARKNRVDQTVNAPMSIYEVHAGSWRKDADGRWLTYRELGAALIDYVRDLGFTHVQFMPLSEHPYDPSWGYQTLGLFAPTSRFGAPDDFAAMVHDLQDAGIGVLCDFVPAHFPVDAHGLAHFDGQALYEHWDYRRGFHPDWNTAIYDWGRPQVANFLISSALYWLQRFGVDGLRVDAVSSMLYLDYSRGPGQWEANIHGGNTNLEAVAFLQRLNETCYAACDTIAMIAEESTAWPGVCARTSDGGLGFGYKWNLGWMHDSLQYMQRDPIHRAWHHDEMTFSLAYAWTENFVLALSHDEVVHGKGSLFARMPGDDWQKFANLRAYYAFMWAHPGKKLLFMGGEFAQRSEWDCTASLDWSALKDDRHRGVQNLIRGLNGLYREYKALHALDCDPSGFAWVQSQARAESVFAFVRFGADRSESMLAVFNFTPVVRAGYRVGVPSKGIWRVLLDTDDAAFGGSGALQHRRHEAQDIAHEGQPFSIMMDLPPLAGLYLALDA